jgi:3-methyladenine DNA glycosylase AlkC
MATTERFSLKDHLFKSERVSYLAGLLEKSVPDFDRQRFESEVMARLPELELKQRIDHIADVLTNHLAGDFTIAASQIRASLPPPLDPTLTDDDFGDFIIAPLGKYVEDHGLTRYETSMPLLRELTMRFSMEGPVRPFINRRPEETLELFAQWAEDENYHVRRLVSESTRPRLPWAPRIDLDVRAPLPLLDKLHSDPTRYVTRSVANHLNDISKIVPGLVVESLERWRTLGAQEQEELDWMTRHALRTLLNRGDPAAMEAVGLSPDPGVEAGPIELATPMIRSGEALEFSVPINSTVDQNLMVDYVIEFVKRNGGTAPKTFKLKRVTMRAGDSVTLTKKHVLRSDATTYRLYPGTHRVTVVVNGKPFSKTEFEVTAE